MEKPQSGPATMLKCKESAGPVQAGKARGTALAGEVKDVSGKQDGSPRPMDRGVCQLRSG